MITLNEAAKIDPDDFDKTGEDFVRNRNHDLGVLHRARKASNGRVTPKGTPAHLDAAYNDRRRKGQR